MDKAYLKEMVDRGMSQNQIAKADGRGQTSVRYWLKKHGLQTNYKSFSNGYRRETIPYMCDCGETDPDKFYGRVKKRCKACQIVKNMRRMRAYKEQAIQAHGGKCVRCGYSKCLAALDFHHRDPSEKDPDFSKMRNWSYARKKAELEKCELVCANCHRELHYKPL